MRRLALLLLPLVLLAACASAQKTADRAAATGDWKTAEANYAAVLRDDPNNAEKRARWQNARQKALEGAIAHCRACQAAQDWECAFGEADYLARMEPGSADYAALRAEVGRQAAWVRVQRASEASQRRDHRAAFDLLAGTRAATSLRPRSRPRRPAWRRSRSGSRAAARSPTPASHASSGWRSPTARSSSAILPAGSSASWSRSAGRPSSVLSLPT